MNLKSKPVTKSAKKLLSMAKKQSTQQRKTTAVKKALPTKKTVKTAVASKSKPAVEEESKGEAMIRQERERLEKQVKRDLGELKEITKGESVYKCAECGAYTSADVPEDVDELVEFHNYLRTTCCGKGDWEESSLREWLEEQVEIEYISDGDNSNDMPEYTGAIITLTYGGPTIVVDTAKEKIIGTSGGGRVTVQKKLNDTIIKRLDNVLLEMFYEKN